MSAAAAEERLREWAKYDLMVVVNALGLQNWDIQIDLYEFAKEDAHEMQVWVDPHRRRAAIKVDAWYLMGYTREKFRHALLHECLHITMAPFRRVPRELELAGKTSPTCKKLAPVLFHAIVGAEEEVVENLIPVLEKVIF